MLLDWCPNRTFPTSIPITQVQVINLYSKAKIIVKITGYNVADINYIKVYSRYVPIGGELIKPEI